MRSAALAALVCAVALSAGCDSHNRAAIEHPRILQGAIRPADLGRQVRRSPIEVDFVSGRRGFLATAGGQILRTSDGGLTWARAGAPIRRLADIDFVTTRQGFATTDRNVLLQTHDGAHSWQLIHRFAPGPEGSGVSVGFVDSQHGWALTANGLYRTSDSGRTWTRLSLPCARFDSAAGPSFLDERNGYLVCGGQPGAGMQEKALYVTSDGGNTWTVRSGTYVLHPNPRRTVPGSGYANGLEFHTARLGLLSAARGGIFRTQTGGLTWRLVRYAEDISDFTWPTPRRLSFASGMTSFQSARSGLRRSMATTRPRGAL